MSPSGRIVLGEDDFDDAPTGPPAADAPTAVHLPPPPAPPGLPPVSRSAPLHVGAGPGPGAAPGVTRPNWLYDPKSASLIAAAIGIGLGWLAGEVFGLTDLDASSKLSLDLSSALWTGVIGLVFVATLVSFDRAIAGAWDAVLQRCLRAAVPAFGAAFAAGFVAQAVYAEIFTSIIESASWSELADLQSDPRLYLTRALGWAIFGGGIGVAQGIIDRSRSKAINGALGGIAGGAAGGIVFQFCATQMSSSAGLSRLLGLLAIGLLIAVATRVVETARREAWLSVVSGGMTGKEFILYHPVTRIGSSPACEIYLLKDPSVTAQHAQIDDVGGRRVLTALGGAPVAVNGTPVQQRELQTGDQVQIGSTVIAYAERALAPGTGAGVR